MPGLPIFTIVHRWCWPQMAYDAWIGGNATTAASLLRPAPANWFNWYRVGPDVGKVAHDHPALATPLTDDELRGKSAPQGDLFA